MSDHPANHPKEFYQKWSFWILVTLCVFLVGGGMHACSSLNYVNNYSVGYTFDKFEGKIEPLDRTGWFYRTWWRYDVYEIDLRPQQVSMNANQRILNAKLVQFDPKGLETFVKWHGAGTGEDSTALGEILKSYAFNVNAGKDCPFLVILDEMQQKIVNPLEPARPNEPPKPAEAK